MRCAAVKSFKLEGRGKRRMHKKWARRKVDAQLLLDSELAQVKPDVIVALGSTALKAITGEHATLKDVLGQPFLHQRCWFPSATTRPMPGFPTTTSQRELSTT